MKRLLKDTNYIKYWDIVKNINVNIDDIGVGSRDSYYWKCPKCNYEWKTRISHVINDSNGCPNCNKIGKRIKNNNKNGLLSNNKTLMMEWNYKKNNELGIKPTDFSIKSKDKVWWKCSKGHEWESSIYNRTNHNRNCPYCANQKILSGYNDLETLNPELAKEWNFERNEMLPNQVGLGTSKKYWWKCERGHEWEASVDNRNRMKVGCPYCSKEKSVSFPEKAMYFYILKQFPEAVENYRSKSIKNKELDVFLPNKRIGIEYDGLLFHQDKKRDKEKDLICKEQNIEVYHIVEKINENLNRKDNYIYYNPKKIEELNKAINMLLNILVGIDKEYDVDIDRDRINIYNLIEYYEKANSLAKKYPNVAKSWNYEKNGNLKPENVSYSSQKLVWWKCEKGHEWQALICNRIKNHGCPYCSNLKAIVNENDLFTLHPEIMKLWDYKKNRNFNPHELKENSNKKVWWKCENGHEWEAIISSITRGTRCPYCQGNKVLKGFNDLATINPKLASEWNYEKNGNLKPNDVTSCCGKKVWWKCERGHEWEAKISNRASLKRGCPYCSNQKILFGYNDLETIFPKIAKEWNYDKNLKMPKEVGAKSTKKYWWKCKKGHEWEATIYNRTILKNSCPKCKGKVKNNE